MNTAVFKAPFIEMKEKSAESTFLETTSGEKKGERSSTCGISSRKTVYDAAARQPTITRSKELRTRSNLEENVPWMARKKEADGERQTRKAKTGPRFSREAVTVRNQWRGEGAWVSEQVGALLFTLRRSA